ncbi:hypothetical protein [Cryptosporangium japonicum]|uniref:Uncharacterized protein n=1 Tax=Cryptosporangium japonicum TaxID=80872 RepID=A0ABN0UPM0_9ACTN
MNLQLPPERDLPPQAFRSIESALITEVTSAPRRRWLAPVAAAVAVLVTLVVVVGALRSGDEERVRPAAPSPVPTRSVEQPTGKRESIVPGCVASYVLGGTPAEKAGVKGAKLYNLLGTPSDGVALIYAGDYALYCTIGGDVMAYNAGGGPVASMNWIPEPYRIDFQAAGRNVDRDGRTTAVSEYRGGRITKNVARMTLESGGTITEAHLENGTFLVRLEYPAHSTGEPPRPTLRAYDAAGNELPDPGHPECLATPDGRIVDNDDLRSGATTGCAPAAAWP